MFGVNVRPDGVNAVAQNMSTDQPEVMRLFEAVRLTVEAEHPIVRNGVRGVRAEWKRRQHMPMNQRAAKAQAVRFGHFAPHLAPDGVAWMRRP